MAKLTQSEYAYQKMSIWQDAYNTALQSSNGDTTKAIAKAQEVLAAFKIAFDEDVEGATIAK